MEFLKCFISLLLSCGVFIGGVLFGESAGITSDTTAAVTVCYLLFGLLAAVSVISSVRARSFINSKLANIDDTFAHYNALREEAVTDLTGAVKRLGRWRGWLLLYMAAVTVLSLATVFVAGTVGHLPILLIAAIPLFDVVGILLSRIEIFDFKYYTRPEELPYLYGMARRAAEAVGCGGKIRIRITPGDNAGIARIAGVYSLELGALLLDVMTEEELYQILLHEFAHQTKECNPSPAEARLNDYIGSLSNPLIMSAPYAYLYARYTFEFSFYRLAASIAFESIADSAIIRYGAPEIAAGALAKSAMSSLFMEDTVAFIGEPYCKPESKRQDQVDVMSSAFRRAYTELGARWRDIFKNEIRSRTASHPILRERIESLGVSGYRIAFPEGDSEYRRDCRTAVEMANKEAYEYGLSQYEETRRTEYLLPLELVSKWRAEGESLEPYLARQVIDALDQLGEYGEMEALCDRIIAEETNPYATAHAHYNKGLRLLRRYDSGGIEHIYRAIELNHGYAMSGMDVIGGSACQLGLSDELEKYRELAPDTLKKYTEVYQQGESLTCRDGLEAGALPDEVLRDVLRFIKEHCGDMLRRVYLVRKLITEEYSPNVFVLELKSENEDAKNRAFSDIFSYLDCYPDGRDFSLFALDDDTRRAVAKVGGSLIFDSDMAKAG